MCDLCPNHIYKMNISPLKIRICLQLLNPHYGLIKALKLPTMRTWARCFNYVYRIITMVYGQLLDFGQDARFVRAAITVAEEVATFMTDPTCPPMGLVSVGTQTEDAGTETGSQTNPVDVWPRRQGQARIMRVTPQRRDEAVPEMFGAMQDVIARPMPLPRTDAFLARGRRHARGRGRGILGWMPEENWD